MANGLYAKGREGFLDGSIDWDTDTIKVVLVDSADYGVNLATHQFLSDVPAIGRVATSGALTSKTVTGGVADADDVTFTAVTGDSSECLVIYKDTGTPSTSRLIAYIDTVDNGSGGTMALSVTPNGGDITITWSNAANKIFKL